MPPKKNSALYFKEEGNKHMAQFQYREAVAAYNQGLAAMGPASAAAAGDAEVTKLRTILHANSAQAHIDQYLFDKAEEDATAALACDPTFFKARYRRAVSLLERGMLPRCRDDLLVLCREVTGDGPGSWPELAAALRLRLVTAEALLASSPPALAKKKFAELTAADVELMWTHAAQSAPPREAAAGASLKSLEYFQDKAHLLDDEIEQQERTAAAVAAAASQEAPDVDQLLSATPNTPSSARRWLHTLARTAAQCDTSSRLVSVRDSLIRIATATAPPLITTTSGAFVWSLAAAQLLLRPLPANRHEGNVALTSAISVLLTPAFRDCCFVRVAPWLDHDLDGAELTVHLTAGFVHFASMSFEEELMCRSHVRDSTLAMAMLMAPSHPFFQRSLDLLDNILHHPKISIAQHESFAASPPLIETVVRCAPWTLCASCGSVQHALSRLSHFVGGRAGAHDSWDCAERFALSVPFLATLTQMARRGIVPAVNVSEKSTLQLLSGIAYNMLSPRAAAVHHNESFRELVVLCGRALLELPEKQRLSAAGEQLLDQFIRCLYKFLKQIPSSELLHIAFDLGPRMHTLGHLDIWFRAMHPVTLGFVSPDNQHELDATVSRMCALVDLPNHHFMSTLHAVAVRIPTLPEGDTLEPDAPPPRLYAAENLLWLLNGFADESCIPPLPQLSGSSALHDIVVILFEYCVEKMDSTSPRAVENAEAIADLLCAVFSSRPTLCPEFATRSMWERVVPSLIRLTPQSSAMSLMAAIDAWTNTQDLEDPVVRAKVFETVFPFALLSRLANEQEDDAE